LILVVADIIFMLHMQVGFRLHSHKLPHTSVKKIKKAKGRAKGDKTHQEGAKSRASTQYRDEAGDAKHNKGDVS
jgi:hypothetical protein